MITTQDTFLERLAEALGGAIIPEWLLTPGGQAYLVARARAEGYEDRDIRSHPNGQVSVILRKVPRIRGFVAGEKAWGEPLATAYAVGEIFSVKLPEGAG